MTLRNCGRAKRPALPLHDMTMASRRRARLSREVREYATGSRSA
jgi:hypothetical protein